METITFSSLGLPVPLLEAIETLGYESPSAIQAQAIPVALSGKDVIGLSQTGSGKTAAFVLPALAKIEIKLRKPQVLILCPTRELAIQVCEEVHRLACKLQNFHAVPVYGGAPISRQFRQLDDGAHLIVGTPGRLLDHLRRGSFKPADIKMVILDEADRMLDMGFRDEMEELLSQLPESRQAMFFSATMNRGVEGLIKRFGKDPEMVQVERKTLTVESIEQRYYEVRERSKVEVLSRVLDLEDPRLAIVFCNTKRSVDEATESLLARGYAADRLHGDVTQQMRERVLARFREGVVEVLVATDVAARGIDIEEIDLVVNYDVPQDPEDYVHRIGRTGRAGRDGKAITFVFGRDLFRLQNVERMIRQKITRHRVPSQEEVEDRRADSLYDSVRDRLEAGSFKAHESQIERLLESGHTSTDIASTLFTLLRESSGREGQVIAEDKTGDHTFDRGDARPNRPDRERAPVRSTYAGEMTKLFLNLGKTQGVTAKDFVGMFYREGQVPDGALGHIKLFPKHTIIEVPEECVEKTLASLRKSKLRGQPFMIKRDRQA
jgi:ATP-dependent RNA helicase DeaD